MRALVLGGNGENLMDGWKHHKIRMISFGQYTSTACYEIITTQEGERIVIDFDNPLQLDLLARSAKKAADDWRTTKKAGGKLKAEA